MAVNLNPITLLLNSGQEESAVVQAPAFSLTKVMAVVAPLVTALATWLATEFKDTSFTTGQITTLLVALIAFLALTGAADVLARGIATSAQTQASARMRMMTFKSPIPGEVDVNGDGKTHMDVTVVAASDANPPELLCLHGEETSWQPVTKVRLVTGSVSVNGASKAKPHLRRR
jgi:hypothetical protein